MGLEAMACPGRTAWRPRDSRARVSEGPQLDPEAEGPQSEGPGSPCRVLGEGSSGGGCWHWRAGGGQPWSRSGTILSAESESAWGDSGSALTWSGRRRRHGCGCWS